MQVTQKLMVSQKEVFDTLVKSSVYDIEKKIGKKIPIRKLEGYSYTRPMSNGSYAKTTILQVKPNETYQFETKGRLNTHTTTYTIEAVSDYTSKVTYDEKIEAKKASAKWNNIIVGFLLGFFRKRRVKNLLKAIEYSIIEESKKKNQGTVNS